jgi:Protein of unknown function (DUF2752)
VIEPPPRLFDSARRRSKAWQAAALAALLGAAALADPARPLPFDVCLFSGLTGLPCPTCGMTRAVCQAVRGHWARSVAAHPAGLIVAAGLAGWMLWAAAEAWRGRPVAEALRRRVARLFIIGGVAVSVVFWIRQLVGRD